MEPGHHLVQVLVVLLETNELLLDEHAATVVEVVRRQVLNVRKSLRSLGTCLLACVAVLGVGGSTHAQQQHEPEGTVLHELHVAIVVHWVRGVRHSVVMLVTQHESLELDRVLRVDDLAVRVVEVEEVVDLGLMELAWDTKGRASDGTSALSRHTTSV